MDPITWADESFGYVLSTVYNFTESDVPKTRYHKRKGKNNLELNEILNIESDIYLGDAYYDRNIPIVKQRLIAAGVRLGALLNKIFGGSNRIIMN